MHSIVSSFIENAELTDDGYYEVENFSFVINPETGCLIFEESAASVFGDNGFTKRKAAALFLWYLEANQNDKDICNAIPFYKRAMNVRAPYFNSNYGQYFYVDGGFAHCFEVLVKNKNSRQACIMINNNYVMFGPDRDKLCTNAIMFRIRDNRLNMTVQMRSNHFINMMPLDVFTFSMFYGLMYRMLRDIYKDLKVGKYYHTAASMHIDEDQMPLLRAVESTIHPITQGFYFANVNFNNNLIDKMIHWVKQPATNLNQNEIFKNTQCKESTERDETVGGN